MFGAAVLLAGCASAPEDSGGSDGAAASDFLPCMVSDAGGFDDKSFNQLGFEGLDQGGRRARRRAGHRPVRLRDRLRAQPDEPRRPGLQPHHHRRLRPRGRHGRVGRRPTPTSSTSRSTTRSTTTSTARPTSTNIKPIVFDTAQAAFLAGYAAAELLEDRRRRHLRRHELPDGLHLHGRLQAGRRLPQHREGHERPGPRLGRHRRPLHRWLRGERHGSQHRAGPHRPERRRAPARRRPDLPVGRCGHPRLRP